MGKDGTRFADVRHCITRVTWVTGISSSCWSTTVLGLKRRIVTLGCHSSISTFVRLKRRYCSHIVKSLTSGKADEWPYWVVGSVSVVSLSRFQWTHVIVQKLLNKAIQTSDYKTCKEWVKTEQKNNRRKANYNWTYLGYSTPTQNVYISVQTTMVGHHCIWPLFETMSTS